MNIGSLYSSLFGGVNFANDLIFVSPDQKLGINSMQNGQYMRGWLFHVIGEETVTLNSDITDHYIEDNSAIQDHISIKPKMFTVSGFIGELNNVTPPALEPLAAVIDKLAQLGAYIPGLTSNALRAYNLAEQSYRVVNNTYQNVLRLASPPGTIKTEQQKAYTDLYNGWRNRQLFYVQTPYEQFTNMAIQSITLSQSEANKQITDITIIFKEIRTVNLVQSAALNTSAQLSPSMLVSQVNKGILA